MYVCMCVCVCEFFSSTTKFIKQTQNKIKDIPEKTQNIWAESTER